MADGCRELVPDRLICLCPVCYNHRVSGVSPAAPRLQLAETISQLRLDIDQIKMSA